MTAAVQLTDNEKAAKAFMTRVILEATAKPCDNHDIGQQQQQKELGDDDSLPDWYDAVAFKRGQRYFHDNRLMVLTSNMCGLLTLLAEPRGLQMLASTGRSSTAATAGNRYVSTVLHVLRWYEMDLAPGSESWRSLQRVRRMHLSASRAGERKGLGMISQAELALTTFGFMGFALIRPHLLGIRHDCDADRAAFVHFWAVMGHLLGVQDSYNMCLQPLAVVEIICQMMLRYIFIPLIQLESPQFRRMVEALFAGLSAFMPHMRYDLQMFSVKRICGVPGYQFAVDRSKETVCRQLFSAEEVRLLREVTFRNTGYQFAEMVFGAAVPVIEVRRGKGEEGFFDQPDSRYVLLSSSESILRPLIKLLELDDPSQLRIRLANPEQHQWSAYLDDSKFYELSLHDRFIMRMRVRAVRLYEFRVFRYLFEAVVSVRMYMMRKWMASRNKSMASG